MTEPAVQDTTAPFYDPNAPGFYQDPYPQYEQLQKHDPVWKSPQGVWIVTGFAEATAIMRDRRFSSHSFDFGAIEGVAPEGDELEDFLGAMEAVMEGVPVFTDPPDHPRLRYHANRAFSAKAVEALRPRIAERVEALLDELVPKGRGDLVADFAAPLSLGLLCDVLGVPESDQPLFSAMTHRIERMGQVDQTMETAMDVFLGFVEIRQYMQQAIESRRDSDQTDLLQTMINSISAAGDGLHLSEEEVQGFGLILLTAGQETTASFITSAMWLLLRHAEALATLAANPDKIPAAVEELLRFEPPVQLGVSPRLATEDVEIGGHVIRRGESVRIVLAAANRDPRQFRCPQELDIERGPIKHLSFGTGSHTCLGAALARAAAQIAIAALLERLPNLAFDGEPAWEERTVLRRFSTLRVTFG